MENESQIARPLSDAEQNIIRDEFMLGQNAFSLETELLNRPEYKEQHDLIAQFQRLFETELKEMINSLTVDKIDGFSTFSETEQKIYKAVIDDIKTKDFLIHYQDRDMINAWCYPQTFADKFPIAISGGLFNICQNKAELLGILGHEIGHAIHKIAYERIKEARRLDPENPDLAEAKTNNTQKEETTCDLLAMAMLNSINCSGQHYRNILERIYQLGTEAPSKVRIYDVHTSREARLKAIEMYIGGKEQGAKDLTDGGPLVDKEHPHPKLKEELSNLTVEIYNKFAPEEMSLWDFLAKLKGEERALNGSINLSQMSMSHESVWDVDKIHLFLSEKGAYVQLSPTDKEATAFVLNPFFLRLFCEKTKKAEYQDYRTNLKDVWAKLDALYGSGDLRHDMYKLHLGIAGQLIQSYVLDTTFDRQNGNKDTDYQKMLDSYFANEAEKEEFLPDEIKSVRSQFKGFLLNPDTLTLDKLLVAKTPDSNLTPDSKATYDYSPQIKNVMTHLDNWHDINLDGISIRNGSKMIQSASLLWPVIPFKEGEECPLSDFISRARGETCYQPAKLLAETLNVYSDEMFLLEKEQGGIRCYSLSHMVHNNKDGHFLISNELIDNSDVREVFPQVNCFITPILVSESESTRYLFNLCYHPDTKKLMQLNMIEKWDDDRPGLTEWAKNYNKVRAHVTEKHKTMETAFHQRVKEDFKRLTSDIEWNSEQNLEKNIDALDSLIKCFLTAEELHFKDCPYALENMDWNFGYIRRDEESRHKINDADGYCLSFVLDGTAYQQVLTAQLKGMAIFNQKSKSGTLSDKDRALAKKLLDTVLEASFLNGRNIYPNYLSNFDGYKRKEWLEPFLNLLKDPPFFDMLMPSHQEVLEKYLPEIYDIHPPFLSKLFHNYQGINTGRDILNFVRDNTFLKDGFTRTVPANLVYWIMLRHLKKGHRDIPIELIQSNPECTKWNGQGVENISPQRVAETMCYTNQPFASEAFQYIKKLSHLYENVDGDWPIDEKELPQVIQNKLLAYYKKNNIAYTAESLKKDVENALVFSNLIKGEADLPSFLYIPFWFTLKAAEANPAFLNKIPKDSEIYKCYEELKDKELWPRHWQLIHNNMTVMQEVLAKRSNWPDDTLEAMKLIPKLSYRLQTRYEYAKLGIPRNRTFYSTLVSPQLKEEYHTLLCNAKTLEEKDKILDALFPFENNNDSGFYGDKDAENLVDGIFNLSPKDNIMLCYMLFGRAVFPLDGVKYRAVLDEIVGPDVFNKTASENVDLYIHAQNHIIFPADGVHKRKVLDKIISQMEQLDYPEKEELCLKLLAEGRGVDFVDLRDKLENMWVDAVYHLMDEKEDDMSNSYQQKINKYIKKVQSTGEDKLLETTQISLFHKLSEKIVAQYALAREMKPVFSRNIDLMDSEWVLKVGMGVNFIDVMGDSNPQFAADVIRYFLSDNAKADLDSICLASKSMKRKYQDDIEAVKKDKDQRETLYQKYEKAKYCFGKPDREITPAQWVLEYNNFRNSSPMAKTYLLNYLFSKAYGDNVDKLIDIILPREDWRDQKERDLYAQVLKTYSWANHCIQTKRDASDTNRKYDIKLLTSLVAFMLEEKTPDADASLQEESFVGKSIRQFLESQGAGCVKFGQLLSSNEAISADIRASLTKLTNSAAHPSRIEIFGDIAKYHPNLSHFVKTHKVGKVIGAASHFVTLDLPDDDKVLSVSRDKTGLTAKTKYDAFHMVLDDMDAEIRGVNSAYPKIFRDAILQVESMNDIELNADIGRRQVALAQLLFDPVSMEIDGIHFDFKVMDWADELYKQVAARDILSSNNGYQFNFENDGADYRFTLPQENAQNHSFETEEDLYPFTQPNLQEPQQEGVNVETWTIGNSEKNHIQISNYVGVVDHQSYKIQDKANGTDYDKLTDGPLKKAVAKANFLLNLRMILSGRAFDDDRHTGQLKVEEISPNQIRINLFDTGSMSLMDVDKKILNQFGQILDKTLKNYLYALAKDSNGETRGDKSFMDCFHQAVNGVENKSPELESYLRKITRTVANLAHFSKDIPSDELMPLYATLINGTHINQDIVRGVETSGLLESVLVKRFIGEDGIEPDVFKSGQDNKPDLISAVDRLLYPQNMTGTTKEDYFKKVMAFFKVMSQDNVEAGKMLFEMENLLKTDTDKEILNTLCDISVALVQNQELGKTPKDITGELVDYMMKKPVPKEFLSSISEMSGSDNGFKQKMQQLVLTHKFLLNAPVVNDMVKKQLSRRIEQPVEIATTALLKMRSSLLSFIETQNKIYLNKKREKELQKKADELSMNPQSREKTDKTPPAAEMIKIIVGGHAGRL